MPWEIDYALLSFTQLKKSKYHLPDNWNITIDSALNLSSYSINWDKSQLPKEFFIKKYQNISVLLNDYNHKPFIYKEDKLWGHLDHEKNSIGKEYDYYITICPDMYFSEYTLYYLIESALRVPNKYFIITPQISKVGDQSWDEITDEKYVNTPYSDYLDIDTFDIRYNNKTKNTTPNIIPVKKPKFAGWFDIHSKAYYEELSPFQDSWVGYGPHDLYSIILLNHIIPLGIDFQQYLLKSETIWMYPSGPLVGDNINGFSQYYRDFLVRNDIDKDSQRSIFESKLNEYLDKGINELKDKKII